MKKVLNFLCDPPLFFSVASVFLAVAVGVLLPFAEKVPDTVQIPLYALAAALTAYAVWQIVRWVAAARRGLRAAADKNPFTRAIVGDFGFRTLVFSGLSLAANLAYAVLNIVVGALSGAFWYIAVGAYYVLLGVIRLGVVAAGSHARRHEKGERYTLLVFRGAGAALLVLEIALAGAVAQMVAGRVVHTFGLSMVIASAAFSFTKLFLAFYNLFKAKRYSDPVVQALRNINLTGATVSLLAMQTSMVALLSPNDFSLRILCGAVGAVVCIANICMGVVMIVRANVRLKEIAENKEAHDERRE